jgi:hypothetical protein
METWPVDKDNRDSDDFKIYLKASNITNTQSIINSVVSISDKYGIEVSSKISKSSYSIDVWIILGGLSSIGTFLSNALSIIRSVHENRTINNAGIIAKYDSLPKDEKRLVRSILQAVQNLRGNRKLLEITYRGFHVKFEAEQPPRFDPFLNILLGRDLRPYPAYKRESYRNRVDYQQEILGLLTNKENMETTTAYFTKLNKSSLFELSDNEKVELLKILREGKL